MSSEALRAGVTSARVVPTPGTPQGGRRRYVLTRLLVNNLTSGTFTDATARFTMQIPSVRLHPKVVVGFRPETSESTPFPQSGATAWLLRLDAWERTEDGLLIASNNIFTAVPLPTTYELPDGTAVDQWRGTVTVPNVDENGTQIPAGKLFVTAMWEPAAGYNPDNVELAHIFQACDLTVDQGLTTFEGGA